MTAYEIINKGFALAGESLDMFPDKGLAMIWLNISMAESQKAENHIRQRKEERLLDKTVVLENLADKVEMDSEICNIALPYAVASYLTADREDNYMSSVYRNRFIASLQNAAKGCECAVSDIYGGQL